MVGLLVALLDWSSRAPAALRLCDRPSLPGRISGILQLAGGVPGGGLRWRGRCSASPSGCGGHGSRPSGAVGRSWVVARRPPPPTLAGIGRRDLGRLLGGRARAWWDPELGCHRSGHCTVGHLVGSGGLAPPLAGTAQPTGLGGYALHPGYLGTIQMNSGSELVT